MAAAAVAAQNLGFDGTVRYRNPLPSVSFVPLWLWSTTILFLQRGRLVADPTAQDWHIIEVVLNLWNKKTIEKLQVLVEGPVGPAGNKFSVNTVLNLQITKKLLLMETFREDIFMLSKKHGAESADQHLFLVPEKNFFWYIETADCNIDSLSKKNFGNIEKRYFYGI